MAKSIIFITEFGFSKRDTARYGLNVLRKRGLNTRVLDIAKLTREGYIEGHDELDITDINNLESIGNNQKLKSILSSLTNEDIIICLVETRKESEFLFDMLNENSLIYGFIFFGELPLLPSKNLSVVAISSLHTRIVSRIKLNYLSAIKELINKYLLLIEIKNFFKRLFIKSKFQPKFVFVSGLKAYKKAKISFFNVDCAIINTHSLDYDNFIDIKEKEPLFSSERYVTFLDDYKPYHPDNLVMNTGENLNNDSSPEDYYSELNEFFNFFEEKEDIKILIAAHPRADYKNLAFKPFQDREIHYNKTAELIRGCKFVLGHNSASLGIAAVLNKPILLLNSDTFSAYNRNYVDLFSKELGVGVVNISNRNQYREEDYCLISESNLYKEYIAQYIKYKETSEINSWDFFVNSIQKLF